MYLKYNLLTNLLWGRTLLLWLFLHTFLLTLLKATSWVDVISRLDVNENYLNMYSLFWTNFWYLPAFYFFIGLIFTKITPLTLNLSLVYFIYITELNDLTLFNVTYTPTELVQFNSLLTNNLNKYHPFLFFISTLVLFVKISLAGYQKTDTSDKFYPASLIYHISTWNHHLYPLSLISLTMGGIWAFQEASWGGFWNWDSSETFGLLFLITSLFILHVPKGVQLVDQVLVSLTCTFVFILTFYCFIQLNFDLVSHNFGVRFLHFFSNSFFYKEVIVVATICGYFTVRENLIHLTKTTHLNLPIKVSRYRTTVLVYLFWWQMLWVTGLVILFFSSAQLINYTAFSLGQINLDVGFTSTCCVITTVVLLFTYWLTSQLNLNLTTFTVIITSTTNYFYFLPLLWVTKTVRWVYLIHVVFVWSVLINIVTYKTNFLIWLISVTTKGLSLGLNVYYTESICTVCDSVFVDTYVTSESTYTTLGWWIVSFISNTSNVNAFFLSIHNLGCESMYQLTVTFAKSTLLLVTPNTAPLLGFIITTSVLLRIWSARPSYIQ